jgi:hypothetical protein
MKIQILAFTAGAGSNDEKVCRALGGLRTCFATVWSLLLSERPNKILT